MEDSLKKEYILREIAHWCRKESLVNLPDLQRGLVWKARQMELLWDSILRGFPIGSFMLSHDAENSFFLMDGQQRFNAIATGFGTATDPGAILWLDIKPPATEGNTRMYWIKASTRAHPWGFNNDDECSVLTADERRAALDSFGIKGTLYNTEVNLKGAWPVKAARPLPLQYFLDAPTDNEDGFVNRVRELCNQNKDGFAGLSGERGKLSQAELNAVRELYPSFKSVASYSVHCNILPRDVIGRESDRQKDSADTTPLEVLFTRLNTGGTRISQDDLNYSAIKAYWKGIKEENDSIAARYMPASKLVMLAFRLALTKGSHGSLHAPLSIKRIRSLAGPEDKSGAKARILGMYHKEEGEPSRLERILKKIDSSGWLNVFSTDNNRSDDAMPAFIRTSIARNSPEVYLLLMCLADLDLDKKLPIGPEMAVGAALLIHWFGVDRKKAADELYHSLKKDGSGEENLRRAVSRCIAKQLLIIPYSPEELKNLITIGKDRDWTLWSGNHAPWHDCFSRMSWWGDFESKEMLLYSERRFLNRTFPLYDPSREDMWESHNRPWDYDHIIPQNWIKERGRATTPFKAYCDHWLGRIGNVAAIPFEDNRAKRDKADFDFYKKDNNAVSLLFDDRFLGFDMNMTKDAEKSHSFAETVFERTLKIYSNAYSLLGPVLEKTVLTEPQQHRRQVFEDIAARLEKAEFTYAAVCGEQMRDYTDLRELDWARDWMGVGVRKGRFFVCLEWCCESKDDDSDKLEIGLRKLPGKDIEENRSLPASLDKNICLPCPGNTWWYAEGAVRKEDISPETAAQKIERLLASIQEED